jgi:lipooligosaccharide transport system permease protein
MWQRNWKVFRKLFFKAVAPTFLEPFIYLISLGVGLGLFVHKVNGVSYIQFIAPGLVASSSMFGASYECTYNSFVRMKYEKLYDAIMATPLTAEEMVVGEIFWGATRSFLSGIIFLAAIALFGLVKSAAAILLLPILFISGLLFGIIGMTFTGLVSNISLFNYYFTIVITPLFLFSGIFFPVEALPNWAQTLARFTPLFHVVRLCRSLVIGDFTWSTITFDFLYLFGSALILFLLPVVLMKRRLVK